MPIYIGQQGKTMKAKIKAMSLITFAALMLMMPLVHAAEPGEPHAGNAMWIEPSTKDLRDTGAGVGYKFNMTVWINLTLSSASWQFKVAYNKGQLNATAAGYTAGDKSDFFHNMTTIPLAPTFGSHNSTHNYVLQAESWMLGPTRSPGYGSLLWIEFSVMAVPPAGQNLTSMIGLIEVYPVGTETYAQQPDGTMIDLTAYDSLYVIPEFSGLAILILLMCVAVITVSAGKLVSISRR
jgi:hypothetical protein